MVGNEHNANLLDFEYKQLLQYQECLQRMDKYQKDQKQNYVEYL